MVTYDLIYVSVAASVACAGAITDVRSRRIPNKLTYPAILLGLGMHAALQGSTGLFESLEGLAVGGGLFLMFFLIRAMGGGDVKLMAAACAITGIRHAMEAVIACALAGGIISLVLMVRHRRVRETLQNVGRVFAHHAESGMRPHPEINLGSPNTLRLPYGIAIAAGVCYSLGVVAMGR